MVYKYTAEQARVYRETGQRPKSSQLNRYTGTTPHTPQIITREGKTISEAEQRQQIAGDIQTNYLDKGYKPPDKLLAMVGMQVTDAPPGTFKLSPEDRANLQKQIDQGKNLQQFIYQLVNENDPSKTPQIPQPPPANAGYYRHMYYNVHKKIREYGEKRDEAFVEGMEKAKDYKLSKFSTDFYNVSTDISNSIIQLGEYNKKFYNTKSLAANTLTGTVLGETSIVISKAIAGVPEFVGMLPGGVETMVNRPEIIGPALIVGSHSATVGTAKAFMEDPIQTSADILAFMAIAGAGAKLSPIKAGRTVVPLKNIKTKSVTYTGAYLDILGRTVPLIGVKGLKPVVGTPKFNVESGYLPMTKFDKAITLQSILNQLKPSEALRFKAGLDVIGKLGSEKPLVKQEIGPVKYIPKNVRKMVFEWIQKEKARIYGSAIQKSQLGKGRTPADIDVAVKGDPVKAADRLLTKLTPILGKRVRRRGGTVEFFKNGEWHHGIDVHTIASIEGLHGFALESKPPVKIKGTRQMQIAEQFQRKGRSTLEIRDKGTFGPQPHRVKDIHDFIYLSDILIDAGKKRADSAIVLKALSKRKYTKASKSLDIYKGAKASKNKGAKASKNKGAKASIKKVKGQQTGKKTRTITTTKKRKITTKRTLVKTKTNKSVTTRSRRKTVITQKTPAQKKTAATKKTSLQKGTGSVYYKPKAKKTIGVKAYKPSRSKTPYKKGSTSRPTTPSRPSKNKIVKVPYIKPSYGKSYKKSLVPSPSKSTSSSSSSTPSSSTSSSKSYSRVLRTVENKPQKMPIIATGKSKKHPKKKRVVTKKRIKEFSIKNPVPTLKDLL